MEGSLRKCHPAGQKSTETHSGAEEYARVRTGTNPLRTYILLLAVTALSVPRFNTRAPPGGLSWLATMLSTRSYPFRKRIDDG